MRVKVLKCDFKNGWYKTRIGEEFEVIGIRRHKDELSKRTQVWLKENNQQPRIPLDQIVTYRVVNGYDINAVSADDCEVIDSSPMKLGLKYKLWESYRYSRYFRISVNSALVILAGIVYWFLK